MALTNWLLMGCKQLSGPCFVLLVTSWHAACKDRPQKMTLVWGYLLTIQIHMHQLTALRA